MAAINGFKIKQLEAEEMLMWFLFLFYPSENWVWTGEERRVWEHRFGKQAKKKKKIIKIAKPVRTDFQNVLFRYAKDIQKFLQVFNSSRQFRQFQLFHHKCYYMKNVHQAGDSGVVIGG